MPDLPPAFAPFAAWLADLEQYYGDSQGVEDYGENVPTVAALRALVAEGERLARLEAACKEAEAHFGWLYDIGALTREDRPAVEALRAALAPKAT